MRECECAIVCWTIKIKAQRRLKGDKNGIMQTNQNPEYPKRFGQKSKNNLCWSMKPLHTCTQSRTKRKNKYSMIQVTSDCNSHIAGFSYTIHVRQG